MYYNHENKAEASREANKTGEIAALRITIGKSNRNVLVLLELN